MALQVVMLKSVREEFLQLVHIQSGQGTILRRTECQRWKLKIDIFFFQNFINYFPVAKIYQYITGKPKKYYREWYFDKLFNVFLHLGCPEVEWSATIQTFFYMYLLICNWYTEWFAFITCKYFKRVLQSRLQSAQVHSTARSLYQTILYLF